MSEAEETRRRAVILDFLPHGQPGGPDATGSGTPRALALGADRFRLFELDLSGDVSIGDTVTIRPPEDPVEGFREITFDDLTSAGRSELEYAVREIVEDQAERFVDVYNEAQPVTLRLHQLDLLPGIGEKLRNNILDERKRGPFGSFADVEERIEGLHDAEEVIIERILEEIRSDDLKYELFISGTR